MKRISLLILFLWIVKLLAAQNMSPGFEMLEKGNFSQAEIYFENILKNYPNNKTAKICYGRAIGLSGNPEAAIELFTAMTNQNPNDLEIELNYAESLLWGKQYEQAELAYTKLVDEHPSNFAALLGFANTYSNLKKYQQALQYADKALEVEQGNANALTSKRYIRMGFAYQKQQQQQYNEAEDLLLENLNDFPTDKETLLNLANLYTITKEAAKAVEAYKQTATTYNDSIVALIGMALAEHCIENEKEALALAEEALTMAPHANDSTLTLNAIERYIQALIWNRKFNDAKTGIEKSLKTYSNENKILALRATLRMYTGNFKQSIKDYNTILANDSASFDGNLGISNAYFAYGDINKSYAAIAQTLRIFENQKDAVNFENKLNRQFSPSFYEQMSYSFDNGKNVSHTTNSAFVFPISTKLELLLAHQYRKTENTNSGNQATANRAEGGINYRVHPQIVLSALAGGTFVKSYSKDYTHWTGQFSAKTKPFKLNDLELGYKREIQNYNADLINSELKINHYFLNYNLGTNFKLGWFTQYYFSTQSDNNKRNLLFTSLYYNFLQKPILKGGINYQTIAFKYQIPEQYFSPEKFSAVEVFADFTKDVNTIENKGWLYSLSAAAGYQFTESGDKQLTHRIKAELGYKASGRLALNTYFTQSNIASSTAAGYNYTEFGIKLKWIFTERPLFSYKN